ncbi:MAG: hypothetical protein IJG08_09295 [Oscillospiraceae bacterium]|nr:hypothetical protein [Oscillospiraceae bacterium]
MKRTTSLILAFAFCLVLLFGIAPTAGAETTEAEFSEGYIKVSSNHETKLYRAITDGKDIFMLPEDIARICGYTTTNYVYDRNEWLFEKTKSLEVNRIDPLRISFYEKEQLAWTMGREYHIETIASDGFTYLHLFQMMYLFHAQWCNEDGILVVEQFPETIIDFIIQYFVEIDSGQATQVDLLINGETKWAFSIKSAFASMFNDFDPLVFMPYWPGEGWFPAVTTEVYKEALLQIAVDDEEFLDSTSQTKIVKLAQGSTSQSISGELESLETILETPETIDDLAEWIDALSNKTKSLKFNPYHDLSNPQLKAKTQELGSITDMLSLINIAFDVAEVASRSGEWGTEFVRQLEFLSKLDDDRYVFQDSVKTAANSLLNEYRNQIEAAADTAVKESTALFLDTLFDMTVFGTIFAILKTGLAVADINSSSRNRMDAYDLSSKVNALIAAERYVMMELAKCRMKVPDLPNEKYWYTQDMLQDLRTCTTLALRMDIRNWANIYSLNRVLNEEFNKWSVQNGLKIKNRIWRDYALLCLLMETERYDRLLILDSFDQMFSDEYGKMREDISPDDLIWASSNPAERVPGAFESFISSKEYLNYGDKPNSELGCPSFVYGFCLHDIDQDGIEELIVLAESSLNPFSPPHTPVFAKYHILRYDEETDKFTEIDSVYDFGGLKYSEQYKSLITDGEWGVSPRIYDFYSLENGTVEVLMYVGEELDGNPDDMYSFQDSEGNKRLISEDEYQAFFEGTITLDFTFLNGQYSGVMLDSETNQPLEGIAIELTYRTSEDEDSEQKETVWSGADGAFTVSTPSEATEVRKITFSAEGYAKKKISLNADRLNMTDLGTLSMSRFPSAEGMEELGLILYRSILDNHYQQILNGWTEAYSLEINNLFFDSIDQDIFPKVSNLSDAGYAFLDLDDNGIPELILTTADGAANGLIYDLYTWWDGDAVKLVSSKGVRICYWLGEDGHIYTFSSGGAELHYIDNLKVIDDKLIYSRALRQNWGKYHYGDSNQLKDRYSIEDEDFIVYVMEPITQEQYAELLGDFFPASSWDIPLTTFDHYKP